MINDRKIREVKRSGLSCSYIWANFTAGRVKHFSGFSITRYSISLPRQVKVLVTHPKGQYNLRVRSARTQTISFTSNLSSGIVHYFRWSVTNTKSSQRKDLFCFGPQQLSGHLSFQTRRMNNCCNIVEAI